MTTLLLQCGEGEDGRGGWEEKEGRRNRDGQNEREEEREGDDEEGSREELGVGEEVEGRWKGGSGTKPLSPLTVFYFKVGLF